MNKENDTPVDDTELTPYLEGRDGVSETYRATSSETPPSSLDAAILHAARASLGKTTPQKKTPALRNYYSMAASLMLGLMLGAVVFRSGDDAPAPSLDVATPAGPAISEKTVVLTAGEAEASDTAAAAPAAEAFVADVAEDSLAEPQPAITAGDNDTAGAAAPADEARFRERTLAPTQPVAPPRNVGSNNALDQVIEAARQARTAQAARVDAGQQEEITVTGSRIVRLSYRDNQEDWVEEIARLAEQLDDARNRVERERLQNLLELERMEFETEWPDVDLDAKLEELRLGR